MLKIFGYLKRHLPSVMAIILLLIFQAYCDLALPQYTSQVVDVGIQQNGLEHNSPQYIKSSELEKILLFMSEEDGSAVKDAYEADKKEGVLCRKDMEEEQLDALDTLLREPAVMVLSLSTESKEAEKAKEDMAAAMAQTSGMDAAVFADMDFFELLGQLPLEQRLEMRKEMMGKIGASSDSILNQMAITYAGNVYTDAGYDLSVLQRNYILLVGGQMLLVSLGAMIAAIFVGLLASKVAASVGMELRVQVFDKVVSFSNAQMDQFSTASLITRSTNDVQQIQMVVVMLLRMVLYAPIMGIGGIIKVTNTNTSMAWIIAVAVLAIICVVLVLFTTVMPKFKMMQKLVDRLNLVMREILTGLQVIRAFSTEKKEEKRFDEANKDLTKTMLFTNRAMTLMMPTMMFIMNGITLMILWFGAKGIDSGDLQVGDMMAFITYTMQIVMSFLMITMVSIMLPRAGVAAGRINEVIDTSLTVLDPPKSEEGKTDKKGYVEFEHVDFSYPGAEEQVLSDITFTAKPGETTAFIGSTGSGKSTLINLIPRFYDVTGGSIRVGGVDVRNMAKKELRNQLGYVPQKGVLFSGTIATNLKYSDENMADAQIAYAAEIAQAADFIGEKEEGYDSHIAQGGSNVSGGQKQRLSIARAIAKKPQIYIFDDSFSALDFKTDAAVRRALMKETKDSTLLIVAQRISTIMNAQQIIVLDEGRIVGKGTHQELLESCEVYSQIAASQLSASELEGTKKGGAANE